MNTAITLTKNYNLSIPKETRLEFKKLGFVAGQKFKIMVYKDTIRLIPITDDIRKLKGSLKGLELFIEREEEELV